MQVYHKWGTETCQYSDPTVPASMIHTAYLFHGSNVTAQPTRCSQAECLLQIYILLFNSSAEVVGVIDWHAFFEKIGQDDRKIHEKLPQRIFSEEIMDLTSARKPHHRRVTMNQRQKVWNNSGVDAVRKESPEWPFDTNLTFRILFLSCWRCRISRRANQPNESIRARGLIDWTFTLDFDY